MLLSNPTQEQWEKLSDNCLSTSQDLIHINEYPYANVRVNREGLINFLRYPRLGIRVWLIEVDNQIVGFLNFGNVILSHSNAFGLVIGHNYTRRGYAKRALEELIIRREEFGITEINGYCHRENIGIISAMKSLGFVQVKFHDEIDVNTIKFTFPS